MLACVAMCKDRSCHCDVFLKCLYTLSLLIILDLDLTISQLDWLASEAPGSPPPNDGVSGVSPHRLFRGCYRSELRFSRLHGKRISQ